MLVGLALSLLALQPADSTLRPLAQWLHTRWTPKEGAPTEIAALAQTTDGYLWLGAGKGLVRFDGTRFVTTGLPDSLRGFGVLNLLATRNGDLWVVFYGPVARIHGGRTTLFGPRQGLPSTFAMAESRDGTVIAGTANGIFRFDKGGWTDVGRDWAFPGQKAREVWFDPGDTLWVQTEDRVVYLPAGGARFVDTGIRLTRDGQAADFAQSRDGRIWTAELANTVHTVPRAGKTEPQSKIMVNSRSILVDRKGSLWIGMSTFGLRRFMNPSAIPAGRIESSAPEAEVFTMEHGLLSDVVTAMLEDNEGNIWVGSPQGLERFRESPFVGLQSGASPHAKIVFAARDTSVWVATFNNFGFVRHGRRATDTILTDFFPLGWFQDRSGVYWAVSDAGLHRFDGSRFRHVPLRAPPNVRRFDDITVDAAGTIWVYSNRAGLLKSSGDSLVPVAAVYDSVYPHASIFGDSKGRIWLAETRSVAVYDHGRLTRIETRKNRPGVVHTFFEDRAGNVWGAGFAGIVKFDGAGGYRMMSATQRIPNLPALGLAEDAEGAWWIALRNGVVRLPPGEAERALADSTHRLEYRMFDQLDGLPGLIDRGMWGPMAAATPDGTIWIATDRGVARLDPRSLSPLTPPPVHIEALRVAGRELATSDSLTIPPRPGDTEIDYTSTSLSTPERAQFRYRMDGLDTAWHDVGTRRRAYYTGLGPGTYRFRVAASNGGDVWSEAATPLAFRVLPAWYQTLWFRAVVVLLIGALGALAAVLVQRRRHRRAEDALRGQYEATLAERVRIAQDLHDTLLQGFAGVTLQLKTAELALRERPEVAAQTIVTVQRLARESLREARERVWDMRETGAGDDDLPMTLERIARDRTSGTDIEIVVSTSGARRRLSPSVADAACRIGREAIMNAVRHANPRRIEISVTFTGTTLRVEVADDGCGFVPADADAARRNGHFGLTGVRERAARLGGVCDVRARAPGGTVIFAELPIQAVDASANLAS